jgi:competence protein ComEA
MVRNRLVAGAVALTVLMAAAGVAARGQASSDSKSPQMQINLNVATGADLEKLPGIGPALAARIIDYRQKQGGFKKIEDLMNVRGIGEKNFLKLKPLVTVAPTRAADR